MRKIIKTDKRAHRYLIYSLCAFFYLFILLIPGTAFAGNGLNLAVPVLPKQQNPSGVLIAHNPIVALVPATEQVSVTEPIPGMELIPGMEAVPGTETIPGMEQIPGTGTTPGAEVSPTASASPTQTALQRYNVQLHLGENADTKGFYAVIGSQTVALANGTASFSGIPVGADESVKIYNASDKQVAQCAIRFDSGESTNLTQNGDGYIISVETGKQNVFIDAQIENSGASNAELKITKISGTSPQNENIPILPSFSAPSQNDEIEIITPSKATQIVSGTPGEPNMGGYLIGDDGNIVAYGEIKYKNKATNKLQKAGIDALGAFILTGITPGRFSISAYSSDGAQLGKADITVRIGEATGFTADTAEYVLTYKKDASEVYVNLQIGARQQLLILAVSDRPLQSPAYEGQTDTAQDPATGAPVQQNIPTPSPANAVPDFHEKDVQNLVLHPILMTGIIAGCVALGALVMYFVFKRTAIRKVRR